MKGLNFSLQSYGHSDVGTIRKNNEDYWAELPKENFFVIADGMGGHNAGEVASREAVNYLCSNFPKVIKPKLPKHLLLPHLKKLIIHTNKWVYELGKKERAYQGMGTTLCSALFSKNHIFYSHVGDSRIYRFRRGRLICMTKDHNLKAAFLKKEGFEESDFSVSSYGKRLTQAIGTHVEIKPDIGVDNIENNDIYFLCSDGLSDYVTEQEIAPILAEHTSIQQLTKLLIERAKSNGSRDNITIIMIRIYA